MTWLLVFAGGVIVTAAMIWLGRLPRASWALAGAAVMLGLTGYAVQGHPGLPGKPVKPADEPEGFGDELTDTRRGMTERFGPEAQWLAMSDGMARMGNTAFAAQALEKGLQRYPDSVDLWVGLGNALVAHGGGTMSPAAALAFDEAARRDPNHPAPPFFAGLAMAQSGDLRGAEAVWSELLARSPADAPWHADLAMRLAQLREALGEAVPASDAADEPASADAGAGR